MSYRHRWALFVSLIAPGVLVAGCYSVDPTAQVFPVTFVNDIARPVKISLCSDDDCTGFDSTTGPIRAGDRAQENISDRAITTRWQIKASHGPVLGCVVLRFRQKYSYVFVPLSQMVPCPGHEPMRAVLGRPLGPNGDTF